MTQSGDGSGGESAMTKVAGSCPVHVALVVTDAEWGHTMASEMHSIEPPVDATLFGEVGPALENVAEFDCVVAESALSRSASRPISVQVREMDADTPVVLVIDGTGDETVAPDADPTDVYVRVGGEARPARLARRVLTVARAARAPDPEAADTAGLQPLLAELPTPIAVTDGNETVRYTNPAYKATFGLGHRLPVGLPSAAVGDQATVECDTLDGPRTFRYAVVRPFPGVDCHVLRAQSASPLQHSAAPDFASSDGEGPVVATGPSLDALTDRQREALQTAYDGGFFDRPKDHNSEELAARLDITRSTYLQHLRTAQRKLFRQVFE